MKEDTVSDGVEFETADEDTVNAAAELGSISDAVVSATDWTTETILNQLERDSIQMNPRFQRRDAWDLTRKSRFIESLLLGLPIPQIVLAERKETRGTYVVLDGKQRLLTLLQFRGLAASKNNLFALQDLEVLRDLDGLNHTALSTDPVLESYYTSWLNQTIRSVVIKNWPDVAFLHLVFLRLNTGSVKLSPQELRQALFPGPFTDFADDTAKASPGLRTLLHLEEPDFRMRDVEVLVRYLAFANFSAQYRGELKAFLDAACQQLNATWTSKEADLRKQVADFEEAAAALIDVFGTNVARRPVGKGRRPFNRAVFDVQAYYFSDAKIRKKALSRQKAVRDAFQKLWEQDEDFVKAVESTTKTIVATRKRYEAWASVLGKAVGLEIAAPQIAA